MNLISRIEQVRNTFITPALGVCAAALFLGGLGCSAAPSSGADAHGRTEPTAAVAAPLAITAGATRATASGHHGFAMTMVRFFRDEDLTDAQEKQLIALRGSLADDRRVMHGDPDQRAAFVTFTDSVVERALALHATLTPAQRARFVAHAREVGTGRPALLAELAKASPDRAHIGNLAAESVARHLSLAAPVTTLPPAEPTTAP